MKKLIVFFSILMLTACSVSNSTAGQKAQKRYEKKQAIGEMTRNGNFTVEVNQMLPLRGRPRVLSSLHYVKLSNDTLYSYLPYYGRAFSVPYGGGKGLNFTNVIEKYDRLQTKKNVTRVDIHVRNEEDSYKYSIDIHDNGNCELTVWSRARDIISFYGHMVFPEDDN